MTEHEPAADSTRASVLDCVRRFPGVHMRGIAKELGLSTALATYHLGALVDEGLVRSAPVGGYVRYFPKEQFADLTAADRKALAVLRQARPLEVVLALLELGPLSHRELVEAVGGSKATLTYHLHKLMDAGIVTKVARGEDKGFHLSDPASVRRLLSRYEPTAAILDEVHDTWEDLFGGHRAR